MKRSLIFKQRPVSTRDADTLTGDIVRGASLVVWAIRDGRDVAKSMHQHLVAKARAAARKPVAA